MSRPNLAPKAFLLIALAAPMARGQQPDGGGEPDRAPVAADPMSASRGARTLLRNGNDYLSYRQYERALAFFREAEGRQKELTEAERLALRKGIQKARLGMREPDNTPEPAALASHGRDAQRPATFALARPDPTPSPSMAPLVEPPGAIQLASADVEVAPKAAATPAIAPVPLTVPTVTAEPLDSSGLPSAPTPLADPAPPALAEPPALGDPSTPPTAAGLPPLPDALADPIPVPEPLLPTAPKVAAAPEPKADPTPIPAPVPTPAPKVAAVEPEPKPAAPSSPANDLLPLPEPAETILDARPPVALPEIQAAPAPSPAITPTPAVSGELPPLPSPRAVPVATKPPGTPPSRSVSRVSALSEKSQREIEEVARRLETQAEARRAERDADSRSIAQAAPRGAGGGDAMAGGAGDTEPQANRLELPRAPSPTEARPIRPIPVPDEFIPMTPRQWSGSRKAWAAAATCHGPLYFQDAVLERYGQNVEQAVGPAGRFLSFPLDDPKQTNQRQQLIQPGVSFLLFLGQVAALPYNLVVDPPWEPEYDLGYARPGDRIPPDSYYLPYLGIGPPLRGNRY